MRSASIALIVLLWPGTSIGQVTPTEATAPAEPATTQEGEQDASPEADTSVEAQAAGADPALPTAEAAPESSSAPEGTTPDGCPPGKLRRVDGDKCCWPGQSWVWWRQGCAGEPRCPAGTVQSAERCLLLTASESAVLQCAETPALCAAALTSAPDDEARRLATELELLRRACEAGGVEACVEVARRRALGRGMFANPSQAAEELAALCDAGGPSACTELARLLLAGFGVERDAARALTLLEEACAAGHPSACVTLGDTLERGRWASRDPVRAASAYDVACQLGDVRGCTRHALHVAQGLGASGDDMAARRALESACERFGDAEPCNQARAMAATGRGEEPTPEWLGWLDEHYFSSSARGWVRGAIVFGAVRLSGVDPHETIAMAPIFGRLGLSVLEIEIGLIATMATRAPVENEHALPIAVVGMGFAPFAWGSTLSETPLERVNVGLLEPFVTFRSYMAETTGTAQALAVGNRLTLGWVGADVSVRIGLDLAWEAGIDNMASGFSGMVSTELGWNSVWGARSHAETTPDARGAL